MQNKKPPQITFVTTPDIRLTRRRSNSISAYLEKHASVLEKRELARENELAAAQRYASKMVIKSDQSVLENNSKALKAFAEKFLEIDKFHSSDQDVYLQEISNICKDYISELEYPEVPVSGIFEDGKGNTLSMKPRNFIAQFSLRSFCHYIGQAITFRVALGRFDGSVESMLELISLSVQTAYSLLQQSTYTFSPEMAKLFKVIVTETGAARFAVAEENIIDAYKKSYSDVDDQQIYHMINELDSLKIISIDSGNISIREKLYF